MPRRRNLSGRSRKTSLQRGRQKTHERHNVQRIVGAVHDAAAPLVELLVMAIEASIPPGGAFRLLGDRRCFARDTPRQPLSNRTPASCPNRGTPGMSGANADGTVKHIAWQIGYEAISQVVDALHRTTRI
jgi:hypothetical protein